MRSPLTAARISVARITAVRRFVADLFLWAFFAAGLAASAGGAGAVLDGTQKNVATAVGGVIALIAGSGIARKPRIRAFLSRPGTLWFLFLFNGGTAVALCLAMDGVKGVIAAACMGLVSLGAAGGLVANRALMYPVVRDAREIQADRRRSRSQP